MLNLIWPIMLVISIIYSILIGNVDSINNAIFESTKKTVELTLTLFVTICLWN